jgi:hypothetical protein
MDLNQFQQPLLDDRFGKNAAECLAGCRKIGWSEHFFFYLRLFLGVRFLLPHWFAVTSASEGVAAPTE